MERQELTNDQSFAIITKMIEQAKGNVRASRFYFLFWGWISFIASLGQFYLGYFTDYPHPYAVWLISIPGWIITMIYGYRQSAKEIVRTYSDGLIMWTWIGFTFSIIIIIAAGSLINYQITPLILLFSGFAIFLSGLILQFKPMILGGSSFWIFTPLAFAVGIEFNALVLAIAVLVGYLIPGYQLKK